MMEHLWEMAELEQKMEFVSVHVPTQRGQKICIAQEITCCLYICNLWRLFRCCRLGLYLLLLSWLLFV